MYLIFLQNFHYDVLTGRVYIMIILNVNMSMDEKVRIMNKKNKNGRVEKHPSLYDAFGLGDRVKRVYKSKNGDKELKGIILAIDKNGVEIYWDTQDGKYRPKGMNVTFTNCPISEIFSGNDKYSPIRKYER